MSLTLALLLAGQAASPQTDTAQPPLAQGVPETPSTRDAAGEQIGGDIIVTARRRQERAQSVPIALSVLDSATIARTGTFSIQQISQQAPTLQYTSSNPRNTALTIRGLGVSFGLANDGLEQGVGFYVDQVYNSRPAASAFDLLDIERVEILRGPQGTLFGKNLHLYRRGRRLDRHAELRAGKGCDIWADHREPRFPYRRGQDVARRVRPLHAHGAQRQRPR
jgi:iron complex outermembrane receptor protein